MNELKVKQLLERIAQHLDEAGIIWAVFAGAAAAAYGSPRPLTDVDILVPAAEGDRVAALLPEARVVKRREDGSTWVIEMPGCDILAGLTSIDMDERMAARLKRHEIAGVTVPVVPPEDNILLKALRGRGPEEGKHDWEDVQEMMAHVPDLDWDYLYWRAEACGPMEGVAPVLERLEALWRQVGKTSLNI